MEEDLVEIREEMEATVEEEVAEVIVVEAMEVKISLLVEAEEELKEELNLNRCVHF